jgi:cytoskeleton protein RodZ
MTKGLSMSELQASSPEGEPNPVQELMHESAVPDLSEPTATPGVLLRQAREAAGLHIAALAVSLKVPVKKLEALEADRLDLLPDAVFVRALAASVCRTLKIDATQVLALLPQTGKPRLDYQHASINAPFRSPSDGPGPSLWAQISRPAVLAGLLLVLGALVLIFFPVAQPLDKVAQAVGSPVAVISTPVDSPAGSPNPVAASGQAGVAMAGVELVESAKAAPQANSAASTSLPAAPAAAQPAPTTQASVMPSVPASSALPAKGAVELLPASGGIIVFKARGESWVEVTDAKGVVVLRRTLLSGESAGATGALPLAAVVGRADATQVQVRGRAFDLAAVSKDNVARFEVK